MISPVEIAPSSAPGMVKTVRVSAGARKQLVFKLTNDDGQVIDLRSEVENPPAATPDFSPQREAAGANVTVRMRSKAGDLQGAIKFDIEGTILPDTGFVEFLLTAAQTSSAGVYEASIGRFLTSGQLIDVWPVLILIEPNSFQALTGEGPLTIPEIRLALLDMGNNLGTNAPFNNLLDDVEFSDNEIIFAMKRIVQLWNETPPYVDAYDVFSFPFRYHWVLATCGQLLVMAAARYRRNRLDYQAGGVAINDQSKASEYEQIGQNALQEFKAWMMRTKVQQNQSRAWRIGL